MKNLKQYLPAVVAGMIGALVISSGPAWATLKVWTAPERVTIPQLNANFAECANNNLTNANISSSAAIAHSKLATPALVAKVWAELGAVCSSSPCAVADSSQVTSVTRSGTGVYVVNFSVTLSSSIAPFPAVYEDDKNCRVTARAASSVTVTCKTNGTDLVAPAASDTMFGVVIWDS